MACPGKLCLALRLGRHPRPAAISFPVAQIPPRRRRRRRWRSCAPTLAISMHIRDAQCSHPMWCADTTAQMAAQALVDNALKLKTRDNVTAIVMLVDWES